VIISAEINRGALTRLQLFQDYLFILDQLFCDAREMGFQLFIVILQRDRFGPIAREPIMGCAVIIITDLTPRRMPLNEQELCSALNSLAEDSRFRTPLCRKEIETLTKRTKLAKAVPTQVVFFLKLLDMFRSGPTRAGFEQSTAIHELHDREHFFHQQVP